MPEIGAQSPHVVRRIYVYDHPDWPRFVGPTLADAERTLAATLSKADAWRALGGVVFASPFNNGSVSAGDVLGGSADYFTGPSNNGHVVGVGFTPGDGAGFAVTNGLTNSVMCSTSQGCH
jgi:hypothetical protein